MVVEVRGGLSEGGLVLAGSRSVVQLPLSAGVSAGAAVAVGVTAAAATAAAAAAEDFTVSEAAVLLGCFSLLLLLLALVLAWTEVVSVLLVS